MFIPIKYHKKNYPNSIKPKIDEIAGHFDVNKIHPIRDFSLHTEYSFGARKFTSTLLKQFPSLVDAQKSKVPMLWRSKKWALDFADFIKQLCNGKEPKIIEIHPPFTDYTETIDQFLDIYEVFEKNILTYFPNVEIFIENRAGTIYKGGKFLISNGSHLLNLCKKLLDLKLKIALDIPQLITAYGGPQKLNHVKLYDLLNQQFLIQDEVKSIHLWGKKRNPSGRFVSHSGDLNTYFEDIEKKEIFLEWLQKFAKNGMPKYFVPEVNSSEKDLHSIIKDLEGINIKFI